MLAKEIIDDLEKRRRALGLPVEHVVARMGVAAITYRRWRAGTSQPRYDALLALKHTIEEAEAKLREPSHGLR